MNLLQVGKIVNTHGLRGDVKVVSWTDTPDVIEELETIFVGDKKEEFHMQYVKYQKNNLIIKFKEIPDINVAEKYKNQILYAEREALGELPDGVYYITDLLGCKVVDDDSGEEIGILDDIFNNGGSDIYDVKKKDAKHLLLPVIDDVVKNIDIEERIIHVHVLEGLDEL